MPLARAHVRKSSDDSDDDDGLRLGFRVQGLGVTGTVSHACVCCRPLRAVTRMGRRMVARPWASAALVLALWLTLDVELAVAKKKDYYALLGVKKNADDATLKKAQILNRTPYVGSNVVVVHALGH
jgi:hypothetical protein